MSVFAMKLAAVISMLIDHTAVFLRMKYHIGNELYTFLRTVGRFAFPVFCFLIVNGFEKSSDRKRYLTRLTAFSAISQLPFSLTFSSANYTRTAGAGLLLRYPAAVCVPLLAVVCLCWYRSVRADLSALLPGAALLIGISRIGTDGIYLLYPNMNVFYTLAFSLALICFLDGISRPDRLCFRQALFPFIGLCAAIWLIRDHADYGYLGILLIVTLWAVRGSRWLQAALLIVWCACMYLFNSSRPVFFLGAALAVIPLLLYNGRRGRSFKRSFYLLYPAHLLLLGLLVIFV